MIYQLDFQTLNIASSRQTTSDYLHCCRLDLGEQDTSCLKMRYNVREYQDSHVQEKCDLYFA